VTEAASRPARRRRARGRAWDWAGRTAGSRSRVQREGSRDCPARSPGRCRMSARSRRRCGCGAARRGRSRPW